MNFALAEMSLLLAADTEPKIFCHAQTSTNRGVVVGQCSMHLGHVDQDGTPNAHVDVHTGAKWAPHPQNGARP